MSCEACREKQRSNWSAWFRWKYANVEIRGCDQHLREIFAVLRAELDRLRAPGGAP